MLPMQTAREHANPLLDACCYKMRGKKERKENQTWIIDINEMNPAGWFVLSTTNGIAHCDELQKLN